MHSTNVHIFLLLFSSKYVLISIRIPLTCGLFRNTLLLNMYRYIRAFWNNLWFLTEFQRTYSEWSQIVSWGLTYDRETYVSFVNVGMCLKRIFICTFTRWCSKNTLWLNLIVICSNDLYPYWFFFAWFSMSYWERYVVFSLASVQCKHTCLQGI